MIKKFKSLQAEGKKIAYIYGNRQVSQKNVAELQQSMLLCGGNLHPVLYVSGEEAVNQGLTIVDYETKETVSKEKAVNYLAIVDGQHRTEAYLRPLGKKVVARGSSKMELNMLQCEGNILEILYQVNTVGKGWSNSDFSSTTVLLQPENSLAKFAAELAAKGYTQTVISKIATQTTARGATLTAKEYAKIAQGQESRVKFKEQNARRFVELAELKFSQKFYTSRYLIDAVLSLQADYTTKKAIEAINELTEEDVEEIIKAKCGDKPDVVKNKLESILSKQAA